MFTLVSMMSAAAAANSVPTTYLGSVTLAITINDLKPAQCAGIVVTTLFTGGGAITGTPGSDLILSSAADDNLDGGDGADCIVGGAGSDTLIGGKGNDILLGGPAGSGTLRGDQDNDVCNRLGGTHAFHPSCETQIP